MTAACTCGHAPGSHVMVDSCVLCRDCPEYRDAEAEQLRARVADNELWMTTAAQEMARLNARMAELDAVLRKIASMEDGWQYDTIAEIAEQALAKGTK